MSNKLNPAQVAVLASVKEAKKATYVQATASAGNGKTVEALVRNGYLVINDKKKAGDPVTYSLTDAAKAALKPVKAAKLTAKKG